MKLSRRTLLTSALLAAATAAEIGRAGAEAAPWARGALRVFDSRSPVSRAWRGTDGDAIDVAQEHATRWLRLRSVVPEGRVVGLTGWSDFVQARAVLEQKGKRLRAEVRSGPLFYWYMVGAMDARG